jgi:hypothetical protein
VGKLPLLFSALLLVIFGLAACGSGESDESKITSTIETALTKTDPTSCTKLMTQAFAEQMLRIEGTAAVKACEQNAEAEESPNPPVKVANVKVEDQKATADITFTGGAASGQTVIAALVGGDGDWKLDEFVRFAKFDPDEVAKGMGEGFESGEDRIAPRVAACIRRTYRGTSRPELEDLLLGRATRSEVDIFESCN